MTILAENLKTIRKSLSCTQMALAEVLDIGFRTYVRYEAGERDAPVAVLVKLAKLGSISLDRLLTAKINPDDMDTPDVDNPPAKTGKLEVVEGSLEEGRLMFKGLKKDFFVTRSSNEKKLLDSFRKLDRMRRGKFLLEIEWMLKNGKKTAAKSGKKKISRKVQKSRNQSKLKKMAKSIKKITLKG